MATSEELAAKAYEEARNGVYKAVADKLRANHGLLTLTGIIKDADPDWDALAKEAIEQRKINGTALSTFTQKDENGKTIDELVPTVERADLIAKDVAASVQDNTGMFSGATIGQVFRGAWDVIKEEGLGGIWTVISGIFNMLFSDGKSEAAQTLKKAIGAHTGADINKGVVERLKAHNAELNLSDENIREIGMSAENSVRKEVGLNEIPIEHGAQGSNITPGFIAANIRGKVMDSLGLKKEGDKVVVDPGNTKGAEDFKKLGMAAGVPNGEFTDAQRNAIVSTVTVALNDVATANPPISDAEAIQAKIKSVLSRDDERNGLGPKAMGLGDMKPEDRETLLEFMSNKMTVSYMTSRPVDKAAGEAFEKKIEGRQAELEAKLTRISIRPSVIKALGLEEKAPGTYTNVTPTDGKEPKIKLLEGIAGRPLKNEERAALVQTLTDATSHAAENHITDPNKIRDHIRDELKKNATAMGFGDVTPENQDRLFTLIANQSAVAYVQNTADRATAKAYTDVAIPEANKLTNELIASKIRSNVTNALHLSESSPGNFTYNDPALPAKSAIKQLEMVASRPLKNEERATIVDTLSSSLQTVTQSEPPMSITQIRDHIEQQLTANGDAMGFDALSADEKKKLFQQMANESTMTYITQMNVGTEEERAQFIGDAKETNKQITKELAGTAVTRALNNMLDPATAKGQESLNTLTLATGNGSLNRDAMIKALSPVMVDLSTREPPADAALTKTLIKKALDEANPPTGITSENTTAVADAIAKRFMNPNAATTVSPGTAALQESWKPMMDRLQQTNPDLYSQLNSAVNLEQVRIDASAALDNIISKNPDFHSKPASERRTIIEAAINDSLRNGSIPDGRNVNIPVAGDGMLVSASVAPSVARKSLTDLLADKITGVDKPVDSYMPKPGTPGVELTGLVGSEVTKYARMTGTEQNLQDINVGQVKDIAGDITSGNISSGLTKSAIGLGSVYNYWKNR